MTVVDHMLQWQCGCGSSTYREVLVLCARVSVCVHAVVERSLRRQRLPRAHRSIYCVSVKKESISLCWMYIFAALLTESFVKAFLSEDFLSFWRAFTAPIARFLIMGNKVGSTKKDYQINSLTALDQSWSQDQHQDRNQDQKKPLDARMIYEEKSSQSNIIFYTIKRNKRFSCHCATQQR